MLNTGAQAMSGNYTVAWETLGACYYSADLKGAGAHEQVFTADAAITGTNHIYDLTPGEYHLEVITGPAPRCGWRVTLTPVR